MDAASYATGKTYLVDGGQTVRGLLPIENMTEANGKSSHISVEDYAMAMIDEVEKPPHLRQRFTVGY